MNKKKKNEDQREELLKYRNHYRGGRATNKTPQDRKIKLSDIEFDEEKLRNLLSATQNRKPKKKHFHDVHSDDGIESDDEFSESNHKSSNKKTAQKKN